MTWKPMGVPWEHYLRLRTPAGIPWKSKVPRKSHGSPRKSDRIPMGAPRKPHISPMGTRKPHRSPTKIPWMPHRSPRKHHGELGIHTEFPWKHSGSNTEAPWDSQGTEFPYHGGLVTGYYNTMCRSYLYYLCAEGREYEWGPSG